MPTATLNPTPFVRDGAGLNVTAALAAPADTSLEFTNSGREILFVSAQTGATDLTVQVNIGSTVLGQDVEPFTAVSVAAGSIWAFGPFDTPVDGQNSAVTVTLSATTDVTVALLQDIGAY